ncbi:MAG: diguanylate cyclase [Desulfobacterales bacterium]|nr:MAG: diguanylate cyclase [Desulfobacterales bacterium]
MSGIVNGPVKVLIVDNDIVILDLYRNILTHKSLNFPSDAIDREREDIDNEAGASGSIAESNNQRYHLTLCDNGKDAVEAVRAAVGDHDLFSMAFIDIRMPDFDGIWTAENIRAICPNIQMVMVTGFDDIDPVEIEKRVPPPDRLLYLQKPFHPYEIRQFASTLAARWKAEKMTQALNQNLEAMVEMRTAELRKAYKKLEYQASHDSLTELLNRRAIFDVLRREISRIKRTGKPITIILADIDHFKSINDTYGHNIGDAVLVETARRLKDCIRPYDAAGRIGGEEFLVVLPECDPEDGTVVAERIRLSIARDLFIIPGQTFSITISMGLATASPNHTIEPDSLITAADQALYGAKRDGRNKIKIICENGLGSFA